jgi:hypothetical protein
MIVSLLCNNECRVCCLLVCFYALAFPSHGVHSYDINRLRNMQWTLVSFSRRLYCMEDSRPCDENHFGIVLFRCICFSNSSCGRWILIVTPRPHSINSHLYAFSCLRLISPFCALFDPPFFENPVPSYPPPATISAAGANRGDATGRPGGQLSMFLLGEVINDSWMVGESVGCS